MVIFMGIYVNPGNKGFREAVQSEIYVDKTGLIALMNRYINTEQKYICVSRPRRFGKSMTLKMLAAYYSRGCDSAGLFKGLKIEKDKAFLKHLNQYDVIYVNMQQFLNRAKNQDMTVYLEKAVIGELKESYGDLFSEQACILTEALERIYAKEEKESGVGGDAKAVPRFFAGSLKGPALCCPCIYDRDSPGQKVWIPLCVEYVSGIFYD